MTWLEVSAHETGNRIYPDHASLHGGGADGMTEAFGPVKFLVIGLSVLGVAAILIRRGENDEA